MTEPGPVLIISRQGVLLQRLAEAIAAGVAEVRGMTAVLRTPEQLARAEVHDAEVIVMGIDVWRNFWLQDNLDGWFRGIGDLRKQRLLVGKVGAAFSASPGRRSAVDGAPQQIIHWQLSRGMLVVGPPWTAQMWRWGQPIGAAAMGAVTAADHELAYALGQHVAEVALRLRG